MSERPVACVTGAARGLGRATAVEFARRGYDLALIDLLAEQLGDAGELARREGAEVLAFSGDLADLAFAESAVSEAAGKLGRLDCLVNNAAWREIVTMSEITAESWRRTIDICLTAPAFLARRAAAAMQRQGRGVIINISSMMSRHAGGIAPAYVAAKGGLDALTYELASLYGRSGVRVLSVNPGAIDTDLSADYSSSEGESLTRQLRDWSEDHIPLGRWTTAEEVARSIVALAGPDFSYVTGTNIVVDGGWLHSHFPHSLRRQIQ